MKRKWQSIALTALTAMIFCAPLHVIAAEDPSLGSDVRYSSAASGEQWNSLNAAWSGYMEALNRQNKVPTPFLMEKVLDERNQLGVPNLFDHSGALTRQAKRFYRAGKVHQALELVMFAQRLSPDDPTPRYAAASFSDPDAPGDLGRRLSNFQSGNALTYRSVAERGLWLARGSSIALFVVLGVFLLSLLALLVRYMPLLARDISDRALPGVTPFHVALSGWILVFGPLAFRLPLGFIALIWTGLVALYLNSRERAWVFIGVLVLGGSQGWSDWHDGLLRQVGAEERVIERCARGPCSKSDLALLEQLAETHVDGSAQDAIARVTVREFMRSGAGLEAAEMHVARAASNPVDASSVSCLEGNFQFQRFGAACASGDTQATEFRRLAMEAWQRAMVLDPRQSEAVYNLALAHRIAREEVEADKLYAVALSLGGSEISEFERANEDLPVLGLCPGNVNGNRYLMTPPAEHPLRIRESNSSAHSLLVPFGELFHNRDAGEQLLGFSIVTVLLLVLAFGVRLWMSQAWFCLVCGNVSSGTTESEFADLEVCSSCVSRRVKGTLIDPKARFFEARKKERNRDQRALILRLMAYLVPGWHSIFKGEVFRGVLWLMAVLLPLSCALLPFPGEVSFFPGGERGLGFELVWSAVVFLVFATNFVRVSQTPRRGGRRGG